VLVTGAGGSIGSELSVQIASLRPQSLVLFERSENNLYTVGNTLADRGLEAGVAAVLGDVTDASRLDQVFAQYRPEIVFHAAAHKHVPLVEANPCEAVKNNVTGTRLLAEAAVKHAARRVVLISSDKAVSASSVMGATKRVGELVMGQQDFAGPTAFLTVRFGNVLGSNGSVVPRFLEQIKNGGPVTVTHPEVRRFFMLLPEAVQLVLHVAWQGRAGGTYVLDMGEQIKVADMARNLIRLSGLVPDEDVKIVFTGLRPGEKLFEELIGATETVQPSSVEKVFEVTSDERRAHGSFKAELLKLERAARRGDSTEVVRSLHRIVPDFNGRSWESAPEMVGRLKSRTATVALLRNRQDLATGAV
jgi:FlaA1/EpsC-like NDP-sugar epimerase